MESNTTEIERKKRFTKCLAVEFPEKFWRRLQIGVRHGYADTFKSVESDKNLLDEQRLGKLLQERYFRMEYLIKQVAEKTGVLCSAEAVEANGSSFAYVASKNAGLTQSYVQKINGKPSAAKFREQLAAQQSARLPFSKDTEIIFEQKQLYGVIAHNPEGKSFSVTDQALGFLQICIPDSEFKSWLAKISVPEILDMYSKEERSSATASVAPKLKTARPKKKRG